MPGAKGFLWMLARPRFHFDPRNIPFVGSRPWLWPPSLAINPPSLPPPPPRQSTDIRPSLSTRRSRFRYAYIYSPFARSWLANVAEYRRTVTNVAEYRRATTSNHSSVYDYDDSDRTVELFFSFFRRSRFDGSEKSRERFIVG